MNKATSPIYCKQTEIQYAIDINLYFIIFVEVSSFHADRKGRLNFLIRL